MFGKIKLKSGEEFDESTYKLMEYLELAQADTNMVHGDGLFPVVLLFPTADGKPSVSREEALKMGVVTKISGKTIAISDYIGLIDGFTVCGGNFRQLDWSKPAHTYTIKGTGRIYIGLAPDLKHGKRQSSQAVVVESDKPLGDGYIQLALVECTENDIIKITDMRKWLYDTDEIKSEIKSLEIPVGVTRQQLGWAFGEIAYINFKFEAYRTAMIRDLKNGFVDVFRDSRGVDLTKSTSLRFIYSPESFGMQIPWTPWEIYSGYQYKGVGTMRTALATGYIPDFTTSKTKTYDFTNASYWPSVTSPEYLLGLDRSGWYGYGDMLIQTGVWDWGAWYVSTYLGDSIYDWRWAYIKEYKDYVALDTDSYVEFDLYTGLFNIINGIWILIGYDINEFGTEAYVVGLSFGDYARVKIGYTAGTILDEVFADVPNVDLPLNVWRKIKIEKSGNTIKVYIDGNLVATGTDPLARNLVGKFKIVCYPYAGWKIDNLIVKGYETIPATTATAVSYPFVTETDPTEVVVVAESQGVNLSISRDDGVTWYAVDNSVPFTFPADAPAGNKVRYKADFTSPDARLWAIAVFVK